MFINTSTRSSEPEQLDDFSLSGKELNNALDKIASINKLLGGNKVTLSGVTRLLQMMPRPGKIRIADIGCGNGDMLRTLAAYGLKNNLQFELTGIDANAGAIAHARALSESYPQISFICTDFLRDSGDKTYDIILCTLTLHHFNDDQIRLLLETFHQKAAIGTVINDLHRHRAAYYLFKVLCFIFRLSKLNRNDGLISILRGFKKRDLLAYSKNQSFSSSIQWKWAFRYQWIIHNYEC